MNDGPNLCKNCGIWSKCERGFSRWLDQKYCRFAVKSERRDQCQHTTEMGACDNHKAQDAARNGYKPE